MKDNFEFYTDIVYQTLPRTTRVWTPDIPGANKNVVFAREKYGLTYCFKFGTQNQVIRNSRVSEALLDAEIPAPDIQAVQCGEQWFELYPFIHGYTMHEWLGLRVQHPKDLKHIYSQLLEYFHKMRHIDFSNIDLGDMRQPHQMALHNTTNTNNVILAHITATFVRLMNIGSAANLGLYHHGITPKNIIITAMGRVCGILDMDEVGICNKNYAFGVMAAKAKILGIDISTLISQYERISGDKLNRSQISTIASINNIGRNILWRCRTK